MINRTPLAIISGIIMFLYAVYFGAIGVLIPYMGATFGLGVSIEGQLFPANFAGAMLGVLLCGTLSDMWGRKTVLLLSTLLFAGGMCFLGYAATFGVVLAATGMVGAGSCAMETVASALASDLYPEKRAVILNTIQIAFGVGATISPTLAHRLLEQGTSWRTLYLLMGIGNFILFLVMGLQRFPKRERTDESLHLSTLVSLIKRPDFGALCLAQALYVGAETGFFSWMPSYFLKRISGGADWAGVVVTLFWLAMTVGRIGTSLLLHRLSLMRFTILLSLGGAFFSLLTLATQNLMLVMFCVIGTGLCFSGVFGLIMSEVGERYSAVSGTAFGGIMAAGGLGGAVVPWGVGVLSETRLDWRGALLLVPLLSLGVAMLCLFLEKTRKERAQQSL
jgi:FHS family glucose/mannose:H+ symporter-like MFS transporter